MKQKLVFAAVAALTVTNPAFAQEKRALRPDFNPESLSGQKIVIFRPSVWVGEQSTGGMAEPNADWTAQSTLLLESELCNRQESFKIEIVKEPDLFGEDAKALADYRELFGAVAHAVVTYQFFKGNRLPTRKNHPFEWTLGTAGRRLSEQTGARYGLFVSVRDEYGSVGRKMFQVLAAGLVGVGVQSGVHRGYAGLVDLRTGNLVWLNADEAMGGDVRKPEGMAKRVGEVLEGLPALSVQAKP